MLRGALPLGGKCGRIRGQQIQFTGPKLLDKVTEPGHTCRVKPVIPVAPFFAGRHQAGLFQQQQVLGHGRPAHGEMSGQFPDRLLLAGEKMQKASPVRLRSYLQRIQHQRYVSRY